MKTVDFKLLSGKMNRELTRIARLRRVVRVLLVIVYSVTLLWFIFCLFGGYLLASADYATNVQTSQYILYGFIFFCVLHFAFMRGLQSLSEQETVLMGRIIGEYPVDISEVSRVMEVSVGSSVNPHL